MISCRILIFGECGRVSPHKALAAVFWQTCDLLLVRATDAGQITALVLLGLSAAFDTVDHCILMDVLSSRFVLRI